MAQWFMLQNSHRNNAACFGWTAKEACCSNSIRVACVNGWLDSSFADRAVKAWQAIARKIDVDGTVHGICRGTEIGETPEFYFERQTFDHDARGLGALIFAGIEVTKMRAALER